MRTRLLFVPSQSTVLLTVLNTQITLLEVNLTTNVLVSSGPAKWGETDRYMSQGTQGVNAALFNLCRYQGTIQCSGIKC